MSIEIRNQIRAVYAFAALGLALALAACTEEPTELSASEQEVTVCNVTGPTLVCPNQIASYTYTTNLVNPAISWSATSGSLTLVGGQGSSTATFQAGSSFTGGSIQGSGSSLDTCTYTLGLTTALPPPTPSITAQRVSGPGEPNDYTFTATLISGVTYSWYVSGVLQQSGPSNTFDWHVPCAVSMTVTCKVSNACYTSGVSNAIFKIGQCENT